jgi:hypothetical protein
VIAELDEKKREALENTWHKVNQDFGSIFSTLLPGTDAKLEPPEGGTFLDGLLPFKTLQELYGRVLCCVLCPRPHLVPISLHP